MKRYENSHHNQSLVVTLLGIQFMIRYLPKCLDTNIEMIPRQKSSGKEQNNKVHKKLKVRKS